MVIQKAIDSMKDKPKDDKKAVAGGIAIGVIVILLVVWSFFFFKKIQRGDAELKFEGAGQEFLGADVRAAQEALSNSFDDVDELRAVRDRGGSGQYQEGVGVDGYQEGGFNQFEEQNSSF